MSSIKDIINNYIENLISKEKIYSAVGSVVSIDASKKICSVELLTGETIEEVRLQTNLNLNANSDIIARDPDGLVMVPKIQSNVIVTFTNNTDAYVSYFSDISNVFMKADNYQFNDGDNGGLINVVDLVTKLNNVEKDLNDLKTAFSSWVTVPSDGGAALKTITATWAAQSITETEREDFEDTKITH